MARPATLGGPWHVFVEVANNGVDFTANRVTYEVRPACPGGHYCPNHDTHAVLPCPRGAFCAGDANFNFTLCPRGTYQPHLAQSDCLRCPIGFMCPQEGMHVPRICPPGFVCDVTGTVLADQPCPEGHFCLEGTATTAATCGHPRPSSALFPTLSHAGTQTLRRGRAPEGGALVRQRATQRAGRTDRRLWTAGVQAAAAVDGATHAPLATAVVPVGGPSASTTSASGSRRMDVSVADYAFDFGASDYNLRRPVPCPAGMYCHPGTAVSELNMRSFTARRAESMYCPEASVDPIGRAPAARLLLPFEPRSRPVGTYCPR